MVRSASLYAQASVSARSNEVSGASTGSWCEAFSSTWIVTAAADGSGADGNGARQLEQENRELRERLERLENALGVGGESQKGSKK